MQTNRISRAKQFLPFDALSGLQEALRNKEIEHEEKRELSEETLSDLNNIFNRIERGSKIKIIYYKNYKYNEIEGIVTNIDFIKRKIQVNGNNNINIPDISYIEVK